MEPLPLKLRAGYKELDSYRRTIFDIVCVLYPNDFHVFQLGSSEATLPSGFLRKSAINSGKQKDYVEKFLVPDAVSSIVSTQLSDMNKISSENGEVTKTDTTLARQTSLEHTQTDSTIAINNADKRSQTPLNTDKPVSHSSSIEKAEGPENPTHGESKTALQKTSKESISNKISEAKAAEYPKQEAKNTELKAAHRNKVQSNQLENEAQTLKKYLKNSTLFRKFESEALILISAMNAMKSAKQSPYPGGILARTISFLMEKDEKIVSTLGVQCKKVWHSTESIRIKSRYRWTEVCMHLWKIGFFERTQEKHRGSISELELFHIEVILTPPQWYCELGLHNRTIGDLNLLKYDAKPIATKENVSLSSQISLKETETANNSKQCLSGLVNLKISDTQNQQTGPYITKQKSIPKKQNSIRIYRNSSMRPSKDRK
ncbi:hypothetical protein DdX_06579 [Ditylenchus destructor]|uniref:Uncharacterized protein n=1 Tax=Ditylenchus destructor TaxID=166010 RepID=A0AAD4N657_9BILA|nr:hypothetical protein DdX_06579 [Ditylenchus destructor]